PTSQPTAAHPPAPERRCGLSPGDETPCAAPISDRRQASSAVLRSSEEGIGDTTRRASERSCLGLTRVNQRPDVTEHQNGNLNPGGKFMPPTTLAIFSCLARSTFCTASLIAAAIKSS